MVWQDKTKTKKPRETLYQNVEVMEQELAMKRGITCLELDMTLTNNKIL